MKCKYSNCSSFAINILVENHSSSLSTGSHIMSQTSQFWCIFDLFISNECLDRNLDADTVQNFLSFEMKLTVHAACIKKGKFKRAKSFALKGILLNGTYDLNPVSKTTENKHAAKFVRFRNESVVRLRCFIFEMEV